MLSRLKGVYRRYAARHLRADLAGFALGQGQDGRPLGFVDRLEIRGARLRVIGWSVGDTITLAWPGGQDSVAPHIARPDVREAHETALCTGFELEMPLQEGLCRIAVGAGGSLHWQPLSPLTPRALRRARRRMQLGFLAGLLRCLPALCGFALGRDPRHRATVKRLLGLGEVPVAGPLETRLFTFDPQEKLAYPKDQPITIVMPVFNAFEVLQEALRRVAAHTDIPWHLILIEDASSDDRVRPWLRGWAAAQNAQRQGRVHLLENAENLGFVGSVNKGFALARARGDTVVLLNSDALVPQDWASRLIRPIFVHPNVASVTPLSNDAEIMSAPRICRKTPLSPGDADALDARARQFHPEALLTELPTAIGFCMAINIQWLNKVPKLDPVFGRGYGEEVDWCQKTRALGGVHMGLPSLFVEHRGSESFGQSEKNTRIQVTNQIITSRYRSYNQEVQSFISCDPIQTARLAIAIQLIERSNEGTGRAVTIALAHSMGGGAERYLEDRLAQLVRRDGGAIILRVGGASRWQLEVLTPQGRLTGGCDDLAFISALLDPISCRHILYSCGVGDRDPVALPDALLGLKQGPQDRIEVLFHDYFALSPSYCLLGSSGAYRGVPQPSDPARVHTQMRPDGRRVDLAEWREAWGALLAQADRLVTFSEDSRRIVAQAYPALAGRLEVRAHKLLQAVPRIRAPRADAPPVVGVLGNIGPQKGAGVVQDMARQLDKRVGMGQPTARLVMVGDIAPEFELPPSVAVHGPYRVADLDRIAAKHGITRWLIPSIWPETFSFTTHEALATGLPVFGFALGAQGAALAQAKNGHPIAFDPDGDLARAALSAFFPAHFSPATHIAAAPAPLERPAERHQAQGNLPCSAMAMGPRMA